MIKKYSGKHTHKVITEQICNKCKSRLHLTNLSGRLFCHKCNVYKSIGGL